MPHDKLRSVLFVLLRRECAGGVHQCPSRRCHFRRAVQDPALPARAQFHVFRAPVRDRFLFLPEHPLSGTRRIYDNCVKIQRKSLCQLLWIFIQDHGVGNPHSLNILGENLRSRRMDLIGVQNPLSFKHGRQLCAFSAGSRAQIKNSHAGSDPREGSHRHSAWFLYIVGSGLMKRMFAGPL